MAVRSVWGWGRTQRVHVDLVPFDADALGARWLAAPGRGVLARGLGRSYGDAAQNAGGLVLDTTRMDGLIEGDPDTGLVRAPAGSSLDSLLRWALPRGWFVPVSPGTRHVTVGGAIAADVHGKNHHRSGTFCAHVRRIGIATPAAGVIDVRPGDDLFDATAGGMGLTGVIVDADVQLQAVESAAMLVDTERAPGLDALLARLVDLDTTHTYTVAWVDLLARGASLGRGVITSGEHARLADLDQRRVSDPYRFDPRARLSVPDLVPSQLLNAATVAAFNEAWYRRAPRQRTREIQSIPAFFHPLDGVRNWNRLYGSRGFTQYQFVVPDAAVDALRSVVERLAASRAPGFLAVLKRFGPQGPGLLSFPIAGWTLAVDVPARPRLASLLEELDDLVAAAGGRVYLAKDARMHRRHLPRMYPNLDRWRTIRDRHDPAGHLTSDLDRRLDLTGHHP